MPRGPVGSAAGLPAEEVDRKLVQLITRIHSQHGLKVTPEQALEACREMFPDLKREQQSALRRVLFSLPGVHVSGSEYLLPSLPFDAVKHRHWRLSLGYLDISDAVRLHELLQLTDERSEGLERLMDRLHTALFAALGEDWDPYA